MYSTVYLKRWLNVVMIVPLLRNVKLGNNDHVWEIAKMRMKTGKF